MAKITLHPAILEAHGQMAGMVFRRSHTGEMCLTKKPDMSNVQWSPAQQEHRERFREAVAYARAAMAVPEIRAVYVEMAAEKHKRPFDMAVSDHFNGNNLLSKR